MPEHGVRRARQNPWRPIHRESALTDAAAPNQYARRLGLFDGTMMTVGGIIGAGIFLNPAIVAERVGSAGLTLLAWALGGSIAIAGALCFAELGARFPDAGGGYVYLRRAFGPLPGFLYGWTLLLIINSGALAAVAEIAARYAAGLFGLRDSAVVPLGLSFLISLTVVNAFGIRPGAVVQNLFTVAKLAALGLLIVAGLFVAPDAAATAAAGVTDRDLASTLVALGAALIPVMFATGGWQNTNFIAAEIRAPRRNLPRAIVGGVAIVVIVYVLSNMAYLRALGASGLAASTAPAAETLHRALGATGERIISLGIVVSTLGILNLFILAAPRVYQAMADDGLFFAAASRLHPTYRTPTGALVVQAVWASTLMLSGTYGQLLDYVVFGDWIFFGSVAASLFVFRARDGSTPFAGFRVPAVRVVAGLFVGAAVLIVLSSVISNPGNALIGASLIVLGVPVYAIWRRRS